MPCHAAASNPEMPASASVGNSGKRGERLALVGPTGAGKSTLAKLMARLYDPSESNGHRGTVSYGGVDLRQASNSDLRRRIVVVPQEGFCFSGSIRENIRIARSTASDSEVEEALVSIGAEDICNLNASLYPLRDSSGCAKVGIIGMSVDYEYTFDLRIW